MSFYHFTPPREEDFSTDEAYLDALEAWAEAEDEWAEERMEERRMEREFN